MFRSHQSCLHYAIHGEHPAIVKMLLSYGANPNVLSPDGTLLLYSTIVGGGSVVVVVVAVIVVVVVVVVDQ